MKEDRDLRWWDIPLWVLSWQVHVVRGIGYGLVGLIGAGIAIGPTSWPFSLGAGLLTGMIWGGSSFALAFGLIMAFVGKLSGEPSSIAPRRPATRDLISIIGFGLAGASSFGLLSWTIELLAFGMLSVVDEVGLGVIGGLVFGVGLGLFSLWTKPIGNSGSATPATTYSSDRRTVSYLSPQGF
jgi:hypothetical protein